ncbi:MAG: PilN domain-containing protein, partial [Pseudohongiella sp.]
QIERDAASRSSNESLLRDIATRETRLQQSQELLEFLRNTTLGNSTGYSEYVKDLSRASFDGIWLTEFRISGGTDSVFLRGNALQTAMVPDYVGRLSGSQSSLQGRLFNRLQSNRVTSPATAGGGELYEFVLETQR